MSKPDAYMVVKNDGMPVYPALLKTMAEGYINGEEGFRIVSLVAIDDETRKALEDALAVLRADAAGMASWGQHLSVAGAERLAIMRKHIASLERLLHV